MKYNTYIIHYTLLLALFMAFSCSGDNQEAPVVSSDLLVVGKSIEVSGGASQDTVRVEANGEWSVTTPTSWIHIISPRAGHGSGSQDLIIDVDASSQSTPRPGTLTISTTDGIQRIITVTQRAGDIILDPQPRDDLIFPYNGDERDLFVTSNAEWTATSNVEWLTINGKKEVTMEGNQSLKIQASANTRISEQYGSILFRDKDNRATPVTIKAKVGVETPILRVTEPDSVGALGGSTSISVRCNYNWEVLITSTSPWAYFADKKKVYGGVSNDDYYPVNITVEPNKTSSPREVNLMVRIISDGDNELTEERKVIQAEGTRPEISNISYRDTTHTTATVTFRYSTSTFPVTECGVRYSTSESDVRDGVKVIGSYENGMCTANLTGLKPNTLYYVCTYATNVVGTTFSNEVIHFMTRKVPGQEDNKIPDVEE